MDLLTYLIRVAVSYWGANRLALLQGTFLFFVVLMIALSARDRFSIAQLPWDGLAAAAGALMLYPTLSAFGWLLHLSRESRRLGIHFRDALSDKRYDQILNGYVRAKSSNDN